MLQNEVFEDVSFFFFSSFLKQQLVQESLEILQKKKKIHRILQDLPGNHVT